MPTLPNPSLVALSLRLLAFPGIPVSQPCNLEYIRSESQFSVEKKLAEIVGKF